MIISEEMQANPCPHCGKVAGWLKFDQTDRAGKLSGYAGFLTVHSGTGQRGEGYRTMRDVWTNGWSRIGMSSLAVVFWDAETARHYHDRRRLHRFDICAGCYEAIS